MADPKGYQLFVNTAASQVRRRLKRFGHGARKIHSAGRNQTLIIHTATGRHLEELEAKFADVGYSSLALDEPIDNLRNLSGSSVEWGKHRVVIIEQYENPFRLRRRTSAQQLAVEIRTESIRSDRPAADPDAGTVWSSVCVD